MHFLSSIFLLLFSETRTSNIAREACLGAGIPINVPSDTVTQACISANQAMTSGAEKIISGQADIVLAGGCETFSDVPIRLSRPLRLRAMTLQKVLFIRYSGVYIPGRRIHSYSTF